jgi:hypothetical protein
LLGFAKVALPSSFQRRSAKKAANLAAFQVDVKKHFPGSSVKAFCSAAVTRQLPRQLLSSSFPGSSAYVAAKGSLRQLPRQIAQTAS